MWLSNREVWCRLKLSCFGLLILTTFFNPVKFVGDPAMGAQILTSWYRPLDASIGRYGWVSIQFIIPPSSAFKN